MGVATPQDGEWELELDVKGGGLKERGTQEAGLREGGGGWG